MSKYVTAKDIVIPAGTEVCPAPSSLTRFVPYASVIIETSKDTVAEWCMPLEEAFDLGLIVPAEKRAAL
jgi:hypothetical protein